MKKRFMHAKMVDKDTLGYSTGIRTKSKAYSPEEINNKLYLELTRGITLIKDCVWSFEFD